MANNFLDALRQGAQTPSLSQAGDTLSQTSSIQDLLQTKKTGKDTTAAAGEAATSNIGEQVARQQTQQASSKLADQSKKASNALGAAAQRQEQEQEFTQQEFTQKKVEAQSKLLDLASQILTDHQNGISALDFEKNKARAEQLGFALRLSNDKYVERLQKEGAKARMQSAVDFKEALQRTVFSDEISLLNSDADFRKLLSADSRSFNELMAGIDLNTAFAIANAQAKQANLESMYAGANQIVQGGIQAGKEYADYKRENS